VGGDRLTFCGLGHVDGPWSVDLGQREMGMTFWLEKAEAEILEVG
jgi:hypothetical protein